jgi:hypothetical protein
LRRFWFFILTFSFAIPVSISGSTLPESEPNFRFAIDTLRAYPGAEVEVAIRNVSEPSKPGVGKGTSVGSFSFLINYDDSQLEFLGGRNGEVLKKQGWEALYAQMSATCTLGVGQGCHGFGPILIKGLAESKYEDGHPHLTRQNTGEWLAFKFKVKNDCRLSGQILPISWVWGNCSDNTLTNFPGNRVWVVDSLIYMNGSPADLKSVFPNDISNCDSLPFAYKKIKAERTVTFINGGIAIVPGGCETSDRGDLNLNGLGYEIADYALYNLYFFYGDSVLFTDPVARQSQIANSDVNDDGLTLRIADLVYLARVIMGENNPLPKIEPRTVIDTARFLFVQYQDGLRIATISRADMGGVFIRLKSNARFGIPVKLDSTVNLEISMNNLTGELRLVFAPKLSSDSTRILAGKREILFVPVRDAHIDDIYVQASTYDGREIPVAASFHVPPPLPSLENCPTAEDTIVHGETYSVDFNHAREGEANVRYRIEFGPGTIDSITGVYTSENICPQGRHGISVLLLAGSGGPALVLGSCRFYVFVLDHAPSILCPPNTQIVAGRHYEAQATAQDPDPADSGNLTFSLVSGPAGLTVFPSGLIQWNPTIADAGTHQMHLSVTDACGASAHCIYTITVIEGVKFRIAIDTVRAEQGADVEVSIRNLDDAADPALANGKSIGGFSFLISYDCACLQFLSARKGALLVQQNWEFFSYRYGAIGSGNCGSGCPSCLIRIVAIADVNDGKQPNLERKNQGELAVLKFRTTSDRTLAGQICPISWFWLDCSDNTISDSTGQRVWVVDALYSLSGTPIDLATTFPSNVSNCTTTVVGKAQRKKFIDFVNGGVQLPLPDEIDGRGDLNLNGIGYELADFVLFKSYFAIGKTVLFQDSVLRQIQIYNSDVNGDGLALDLSDLVTMARILTGDANPLPTGQPQPVYFSLTNEGQDLIVTTTSDFELGGIFLRFNFSGTVGLPLQLAPAASMEFAGSGDSSELRVLLVASEKDAKIPAGTQRVLSIPYTGTLEPVETAASTYYGMLLPTMVSIPTDVEENQRQIPKNFSLSQNYPNPFNPSTSFSLTLPKAGRYSVRIYNLAGQVVKSFEGEASAGKQVLTWDGADQNEVAVSSGIYFYKVEANGFYQTRKMILIR